MTRQTGDEENPLGVILGVWAHPDDESFTAAGVLMRGVRAGDRVCCVTATRGEGSRLYGERGHSSAKVGEVREAELGAALDVIGVAERVMLGYRSDELRNIDEEEVISRIADVIERFEPDSVLTHNGLENENLQHRAVSSWTTEACRHTLRPRGRLFFGTPTPE